MKTINRPDRTLLRFRDLPVGARFWFAASNVDVTYTKVSTRAYRREFPTAPYTYSPHLQVGSINVEIVRAS